MSHGLDSPLTFSDKVSLIVKSSGRSARFLCVAGTFGHANIVPSQHKRGVPGHA